ALVGKLEAIRLEASTPVEGKVDTAGADRKYEDAFREARLGTPDEPAEVVAGRVRQSKLREGLVAALDSWAAWAAGSARQRWARAAARAAASERERGLRDPHVWRSRRGLERRAAKVDVERLSPQLLYALTGALEGSGGDPLPLLRQAQAAHP